MEGYVKPDAGQIAKDIREKRQRLHMTQKELADATGLSGYGERTIRRWENMETRPSPLEYRLIMNYPEEAPFRNRDEADYSMIDLFAGIGGIRLGFYQTGRTKVVFSSEIDKYAARTYAANFGESPQGDITKIDASDIPDHDILVGGFPCQSFSCAGRKKGFEDTRGTMFFEIARIIREKKPRAFLLENVKNLTLHDNGRTFEVIKSTLRELGYEIYPMLFKATDFGVPQNRERIYIAGFNREKVPNYKEFAAPVPVSKKICVGDILETNVDSRYTISDQLWSGHRRRRKENHDIGRGFGYRLFNAESPYTGTLSARYYKDGSEILIEQDGRNPRKLTPRECARLQGFPEDFVIPVSDTQAYKEFGNSVAVPVIHAIAEQIISVLDKSEKSDYGQELSVGEGDI